jgi:hypothetical protein
MQSRIINFVIPALLLAGSVSAQERTERFIPIGMSPGISGVYSMVGTIGAVDADARTVTVQSGVETWTVRVTDETDIWIDRSGVRQTNLVGSWSDLEVGRTIEIKCVDYETKEEADWVKVAGGPGGVGR